jgi:hypothetical protein
MAQAGARIPAWRRLGLTLKSETPSGVTAPEPSTPQSDRRHFTPHGEQIDAQGLPQSPIVASVNGKSSKLGKRKHQHDPAEVDDQKPKKGRISLVEHTTSEAAATQAPPIVEPTTAPNEAPGNPPPSDTHRPKGDPNYRKKKEKPNKGRRHPAPEAATLPNAGPKFDSRISPDSTEPSTLLASTETDDTALAPITTPRKQRKPSRSITKDLSGSPSGTDRRKSVAFTPDTKRSDGHSAQNLFKQWVAEQKAGVADPSTSEITVTATSTPETKEPTKIVPAKKQRKSKIPASEETPESSDTTPKAADTTAGHSEHYTSELREVKSASTSTTNKPDFKGKKKDPSFYIAYLTQYHTNRAHWKFNKAKQNDVVDNALNIFRIPEEHSEALQGYISGLQGAGVIERLRGRCNETLKDIEVQEAEAPMDDPADRKATQEQAQQERIKREQKRRKTEGDVESLMNHPHGDGYIRRLRRERALALLAALSRTAPIIPSPQTNGINPMMKDVAPPVRDSKKRKRRVAESDSDSSSSDESSSSESESEESDQSNDEADSSNSDSSSEGSDNDSD